MCRVRGQPVSLSPGHLSSGPMERDAVRQEGTEMLAFLLIRLVLEDGTHLQVIMGFLILNPRIAVTLAFPARAACEQVLC